MSIFSSFANQARLRSCGGNGASDMDILLLRPARRRDAIDHAVMIGFAGIDPRRSEGGLVGRVGKFLGFERDAVAHAVEMAALADERAVEEVAGIDLHARLGRPQLEHAARFPIGRASVRGRVRQYVLISVVAGSLKKQTNT